ncbi:MAG: ATP-binding protein [Oscillospiraceae bacterium]|nr:ATP-binding protein [Oscillospiraceae bacterium]
MNKKIFRGTLLTAVLVLAAGVALIFGVLHGFFENQIKAELAKEAEYVSYALKNEGTAFLENFNAEDERITLIAADGTVLADTAAEAADMENHSDREEIRQAFEKGAGESVRYSDTLTEKTVYYAMLLDDGNVLRVSTTQYTVPAVLLGLSQPVAVIIIFAFLLSLFLSARTAKSIVKPINALDLDSTENNDAYEELAPLLKKIAVQKRTIGSQLKEAGRRQEEFRLITENMREGFLVIDSGANLLTYNSAALKLLEIAEPVGGSVLTLNRTKSFREAVERVLESGHSESEITLNGRMYSLIANAVLNEEKIIGAVIVILDVTESAKREQLRREFTSNVSHELKTPLTSISGFAEILKSGGASEETVADFSSSIYDEAQRLIALVSDIIKISQMDEGYVQFEKEKVDLFALAEEIAERLKSSADRKNVRISVLGEAAEIFGVRKILDEMIYNLLDNAVKYNKENGLADIIVMSAGNTVTLTVRDTGIGIPKSCRDRVFERFYRVDKSRSKAVGGTGLGLSIVKHGAAYHGAEIVLESDEGKGTSVSVKFAV